MLGFIEHWQFFLIKDYIIETHLKATTVIGTIVKLAKPEGILCVHICEL
jgi:hypothetical protein